MRVFVCEEMIHNIEVNIDKIKNIQSKFDEVNYEAYYIYAFALFESAVCEAIRHVLTSFPEKIRKNLELKISTNVIYNNIYSPRLILAELIENEIKKINKGSAQSIVSEAEKICNVNLTYDKRFLKEISDVRNKITHESTDSKQEYLYGSSYYSSQRYSLDKLRELISYLLVILQSFAEELEKKYQKYNRYKLLKELWNTLLETPLLKFENCISIGKNNNFGGEKMQVEFNFEYIRKVSTSISSSEKLYLSMFLQQYNTSINSEFFSFSDIPMLASIASKEKIYMFLHVMSIYPHLFNGMSIK
ncbi:hypothetical protein [Oceanobacillus sojae]|uniref:RiboL-PSP-HEPN domain-containing protein n=1 Tax=Oceanobacillus sojae TaxID=582851 RepID=A0A511ZQQ1_9BACI|nr:hypothetical protein [Oceanobacillus sojae]GEN89783.1 hypothetical protein OSO01_45220 [Oceanobacillus sojae]